MVVLRCRCSFVSPTVNMKGVNPDQFFSFYTGLLAEAVASHVDLPRLRGEHLVAAGSEQFTPFGSMQSPGVNSSV